MANEDLGALQGEHAPLVRLFDELAGRADGGELRPGDAAWRAAEAALARHMDAEEVLLPALQAEGPRGAAAVARVQADHEFIRETVAEIRDLIAIGAVRPAGLHGLVKALREHEAREEESFYPWVEALRRAPRWIARPRVTAPATPTDAGILGHMTVSPVTIRPEQTVDEARALMSTHGIHHLPVLIGGVLVGMVTQAQIDHAATHDALVESVMSARPTLVAAATPLTDAFETMLREHVDYVAVVHNAGVVGIFTAEDARRALLAGAV